MADISETIQISSDDAADIGTTPTYDEDDASYYHSATASQNAIIGYRFQGVDIPSGATITWANLKVPTFAGCAGRGGCSSACYMVAVDDAATWSAGNRPKDASYYAAVFGHRTTIGADISDGLYVMRDCNTSNAFPISYLYQGVQLVIDRPGWNSGQDMAVLFLKSLTFGVGNSIVNYNYDAMFGVTATLEITYSSGESSTATPTVKRITVLLNAPNVRVTKSQIATPTAIGISAYLNTPTLRISKKFNYSCNQKRHQYCC